MQKNFLWNDSKPKIKDYTLCKCYKEGGLKNVDVHCKILSLKFSWMKRLYDDSFHEWKIIPLRLIKNVFGEHFVLHSNLSFKASAVNLFPTYYREIFNNWKNFLPLNPVLPSSILSQPLWYNKFILIANEPIFWKTFSICGVNFVDDLFSETGKFKTWENLQDQFNLTQEGYFQWQQLKHSIPSS